MLAVCTQQWEAVTLLQDQFILTASILKALFPYAITFGGSEWAWILGETPCYPTHTISFLLYSACLTIMFEISFLKEDIVRPSLLSTLPAIFTF